jgi:WD40 repeat protein
MFEMSLAMKGCSADEQGNCIVWDTDTRKAVHYFPLHGHPLLSLAFNSSSEWLACVSLSRICCKWLAAAGPEDVLDLWLDDSKVNANSVALTKDLLGTYPHLPNVKVLTIIERLTKLEVSMNLSRQLYEQDLLQEPQKAIACNLLQLTA